MTDRWYRPFVLLTGVIAAGVIPGELSFIGLDAAAIHAGPLHLDGVALLLVGLTVFWLKPRQSASRALLAVGLSAGVLSLTATSLYGLDTWIRVHVVAAALLPATLIHLAMVFPSNRIERHRKAALAAVYAPFIAAGVVGAALYTAAAYPLIHVAANVALDVSTVLVGVMCAYDLYSSTSPLTRRRAGVVALGVLFPSLLIAASAQLGGEVPPIALTLTWLLLPLSIGYVVLEPRFFAIDSFLRQALTYAIVVTLTAVAYCAVLYLYGRIHGVSSPLAQSPVPFAFLTFASLFLIRPIRSQIQRAVDRLFFGKHYDAASALAALSHDLGSVDTDEDVARHTLRVFAETFNPSRAALFRLRDRRWVRDTTSTQVIEPEIDLPVDWVRRLEGGEILSRYGSDESMPAESGMWQQLQADLLLPVRTSTLLTAVVLLGPKHSGCSYAIHDVGFLRMLSNLLALALTNATTFSQLRELNHSLEQLNLNLEQQVRDRTAAVHDANAELQRSLNELQVAYEQLEKKQATLMRADRLATLGRLTAGIAHEMNTPLSAVRNALKIIGDLGLEYSNSIGDPDVLPDDHCAIAAEIVQTAHAADDWAKKAATFIRSVKSHGRDQPRGSMQRFTVSSVVAEMEALLAHRLRAACCQIDYQEDVPGIEVMGEASRLSQVLVNLVSNAIDALEDAGIVDARIEVGAARSAGTVLISVRDRAGGIPPQVLPHIFDELFTTKGAGRGTGLGLWIARNLIEEGFGGTLDVLTTPGLGSCFTASIPVRESGDTTVAEHRSASQQTPLQQPAPKSGNDWQVQAA